MYVLRVCVCACERLYVYIVCVCLCLCVCEYVCLVCVVCVCVFVFVRMRACVCVRSTNLMYDVPRPFLSLPPHKHTHTSPLHYQGGAIGAKGEVERAFQADAGRRA